MRGATLVGRRNATHALHWRTVVGGNEGKIWTESETELKCAHSPSQGRVPLEQRGRCSELLIQEEKRFNSEPLMTD